VQEHRPQHRELRHARVRHAAGAADAHGQRRRGGPALPACRARGRPLLLGVLGVRAQRAPPPRPPGAPPAGGGRLGARRLRACLAPLRRRLAHVTCIALLARCFQSGAGTVGLPVLVSCCLCVPGRAGGFRAEPRAAAQDLVESLAADQWYVDRKVPLSARPPVPGNACRMPLRDRPPGHMACAACALELAAGSPRGTWDAG